MQPEIVAFQICVQIRQAIHLWGESGIGKTAVTQALADAIDEKYWPVIMSIREPSDQGGLPVIDHDTKSVWMAPPKWARELVAEGKGIVHLDELNVAPPTTQNSGLRIVNEGWAGDLQLPDETSFIACGNPPETNPGVYALTPAMANRFVHIEFPKDVVGWCNGMEAGFPPPVLVRVAPHWRLRVPQMRSLVSTFIRSNPDRYHEKPQDTMDSGRAWNSPRMWDTAAHVMAAAMAAGQNFETHMGFEEQENDEGITTQVKVKQLKSRVVRVLVEGCVGYAAAREFFTWLVQQDLRDPEEYLEDPTGTPLPARQDQLTATLAAVVAASLSDHYKTKAREKRYRSAWRLIGRIADTGKLDVAMVSSCVLAKNMPNGLENDLPEECEKMLPMLKEAGIDFSTVA